MKKLYVALIVLVLAFLVGSAFAAPTDTHNKDPWSSAAFVAQLATQHAWIGDISPAAYDTLKVVNLAHPDGLSIVSATSGDPTATPERDSVDRAIDRYGTARELRTDIASRSRPLRC